MSQGMTLNDFFGQELDGNAIALRRLKHFGRSKMVQTLFRSIDYLKARHACSSYMFTSGSNIYITLNLRGLDGLKDEGLAALLNSMVHHEPDTTSNTDYAQTYSREYRFSWNTKDKLDEEDYSSIQVTIGANFKSDSDTCRRVITGYRAPSTEPTPIYELRCDGDGTELSHDNVLAVGD